MGMLPDRGALRAVCTQIKRAVIARLLTDPDPILDLRYDGTTDRAMGADRLFNLELGIRGRRCFFSVCCCGCKAR